MPPRGYRTSKHRQVQLRLLLTVLCRLHASAHTAAGLAEHTGAHPRTIWRVLAALRDERMVDSWREGRESWHRLSPRWWARNLPLGGAPRRRRAQRAERRHWNAKQAGVKARDRRRKAVTP